MFFVLYLLNLWLQDSYKLEYSIITTTARVNHIWIMWYTWRAYLISLKSCVTHVPPVQYALPPPSTASRNPTWRRNSVCFHNWPWTQTLLRCAKVDLHAGQQTARHCVWQRLTWCWNLMGSRAFTGTTLPYLFQSLRTYNLTLCYVHYSCYSSSLPTSLCMCLVSECVPILITSKGYTWSSLTTDTPPFSSERKASFEHFLSRSKPIRMSAQKQSTVECATPLDHVSCHIQCLCTVYATLETR